MEILSRCVLTYLTNAVWQVGVVAAAAAVVDLLFRRAPSRYRHAVWFIALAAAAFLPLRSLTEQDRVKEEAAAPVEAPGAVASIAAHETPPNPLRVASQAPSGSQPLRREAWLNFRRRWPLQVSPFLAHALLALYMAFLLVRLRKFALAWTKTNTLRASAFPRDLPEHVALIVARSRAAVGLLGGPAAPRRSADILFSSSISLPVTLGALRPVILLPDGLVETMDSNDLTAALLHEMAHVRRHDFLLNLLAEILVLPLAFHPGAIFLKRRIDQTRELACDELAAASLESPATYARSLVSMARKIAAPVPAAAASVGYTLGVQDADILEERVMKLLDKKARLDARLARTLLALAVTVLAAVSLSISAFSLNPVNTSKTHATFDTVLHPNFSGTWKLDTTKSELPNPSPGRIVEVIDQRESQLTIKTESGDWPMKKPVAVALFPLLMPDFRATIDNSETIQSYGPGQLKSRTHWQSQKLLTEWKLEREGQTVLEGTWLRALDQDEKTQTLELDAHDPRRTGRGTAKLVFLKSAAQPEVHQERDATARTEGVGLGAGQGVGLGVAGGVPGGVVGGVIGGVAGGVRGSAGAVESQVSEGTAENKKEDNAGSVSGVVTDASGARVPNAIVTLSSRRPGFSQTVTTNNAGEYAFKGVPPGAYELKVVSPGFQVQFLQHVIVGPAQVPEEYKGKPYRFETRSPFIPVVLAVGTVAESVVVKAKAPPNLPAKSQNPIAPTRLRVGGNVEAAKLITSRHPEYPEEARVKGIEGTVVLDAVISVEGAPLSLKVISSPEPALSDAATKAVREWRYKPTLLNGEPIEVVTTITVRFELER